MFDRKERTWIGKTGVFDRKRGKALKRQVRNWVLMNVLMGKPGRTVAIRALRKRAMRAGLRQIGLMMGSATVSRLFRRKRPVARINRPLAVGAALGAGVGLMYLFDPDRGASRRATLKGGATHAIHKTGSIAGAASRDIANRARGLAARAGSIFRGGATEDDTLVARVRSGMGRAVSHPHAIEVTAQEGRVTLTGAILAREVDELLSRVRSISGVRSVDNRLQAYSNAGDMPDLQGGRERRGARSELMQSNWTPAARLLGVAAGGALIGLGLRRRDALGFAAGTLGAGLMMRGATNIEMKRLIGLGGRRAIDFQKTININAPIERVFDFWKNPENFPHFMTNVREVRDLGEGRSQWTVAGPAGASVKWNATITRFVPNELIAWKSEPGSAIANAGIVKFEPGRNGGTRVTVKMSYNPPAGAIGHLIATIFGANPKREMDQDLLRMKTMIETGRAPRDAAQPMRGAPYGEAPIGGEIIH